MAVGVAVGIGEVAEHTDAIAITADFAGSRVAVVFATGDAPLAACRRLREVGQVDRGEIVVGRQIPFSGGDNLVAGVVDRGYGG